MMPMVSMVMTALTTVRMLLAETLSYGIKVMETKSVTMAIVTSTIVAYRIAAMPLAEMAMSGAKMEVQKSVTIITMPTVMIA